MGRTGVRGKGMLWRWGPNHEILAVCTRWRQTFGTDGAPSGFLYVEGKKVLEFIAGKKDDEGEENCFGLPGVLYFHILSVMGGDWSLTALSTIFQLYRGGQFY